MNTEAKNVLSFATAQKNEILEYNFIKHVQYCMLKITKCYERNQ